MKETLEKPEIYFTDVVLLCWRSVSPKREKAAYHGEIKSL